MKNKKLEHLPWHDTYKTSHGKELSPLDEDWVYIRVAAVARKMFIKGHVGVNTLRHIFGTKGSRGL